MSIIHAWWLLLIFGIAISLIKQILPRIGIKLGKDSFFTKYASILTLLLVYCISLSLFCGFSVGGIFGIIQAMNPEYYALYPDATSTEFIFSGASFWLKDLGAAPFSDLGGMVQYPFHLFVGILIFCAYPLFLRWGVRLGEVLFGSKPDKKGALSLL